MSDYLTELTEFALTLARVSAEAILPHFRQNVPVDVKVHETWDPVTEGDRAGERAIRLEARDEGRYGSVWDACFTVAADRHHALIRIDGDGGGFIEGFGQPRDDPRTGPTERPGDAIQRPQRRRCLNLAIDRRLIVLRLVFTVVANRRICRVLPERIYTPTEWCRITVC